MEAPVRIAVASVQADGAGWRIGWDITNLGNEALVIEDAWVPHGRFRGEGHVTLETAIRRGGTTRVELKINSQEAPGTVVENAFLILRVSRRWRVFARMRIEFEPDGAPRPVVENVTAQSLQ